MYNKGGVKGFAYIKNKPKRDEAYITKIITKDQTGAGACLSGACI